MIDLNTLFSNALTAAITEATKPLLERIAALEVNIAMMQNSIDQKDTRIAALENNPAQGVDTQPAPAIVIDEAKMVEALNSQEWFWDKLRNFIDAGIESAIDTHCETYDHDSYDSVVSDLEDRDFDDIVTRDDVRSEIEDVLNNATISLRI